MPAGRPPIRPNPLDPGICERICERLIGGEALSKICLDDDMPAQTMVFRAMAADEEFGRNIARARVLQQEAEVERCVDMADDATEEDWQVVKLRIWARQWRASKLAPKKYGDRVINEHSGPDGGPIETKDMSDSDAARRIAFLLARALTTKEGE